MMTRYTDKFRRSVMIQALALQSVLDDDLVKAMENATSELVDEYGLNESRWDETFELLDSFYKYGDNLDY